MPVPDFQSFFKPLLDIATDGKEHSLKEAREKIAEYFTLTDAHTAELLQSGNQNKFDNRVAMAKSYFVQAQVLESPRRCSCRITDLGKTLLGPGQSGISVRAVNN